MIPQATTRIVSLARLVPASTHKPQNKIDLPPQTAQYALQGDIQTTERVADSILGTNCTPSEPTIHVGPLRVAECVARPDFAALSRDVARFIAASDRLPDACTQRFALVEDHIADARQRSAAFFNQKNRVSEVLSPSAQPTALPEALEV
ncbi:hypothetical protein [Stenotrophomonas rhizophila]|uniref:hypothetical protein n=1 Tax=Stenotrophomonas rhizophila TaxID=216778 RepID=UPI000456CA7C|nr:hypothetical protein [Stenotrophomonas rhizophila]AHY60503.1 hypothetical protein DX03_17825 [Stenotrophomonas rhizophila]